MPVQVLSTTVIDDNNKLQNIDGANGKYDSFHPNTTQITNVLNLDYPVMTTFMTGDVTFSESNKAAGKISLLLLDTSSDQHTPTFSSNIKWAGGSAPDWSGYQHWQIVLQCKNGIEVRAIAAGYTAVIPPYSMETSFSSSGEWEKQVYAESGTPGVFPEASVAVRFTHETANNRIKVAFYTATSDSITTSTYDTYVNYTGLTNITSVEAQYNVDSQSCSGDCNSSLYGFGPTPVNEGLNPGTYYSVPTSGDRNFQWMAQADPNEFADGVAQTTAVFPTDGTPSFKIKVVCDQGTFYSDCTEQGFIWLRAVHRIGLGSR